MSSNTKTAGLSTLAASAIVLLLTVVPVQAQTSSPCDSEMVVPVGQDTLRADCEVLWGFYTHLDDPGVLDDAGPGQWRSSNAISTWHGVTVNQGRVTALDLHDNGLSGSIPSELGRLANLQTLQLNGNKLTGSIPSELGRLANLQFLRLHDNGLSGSIPSELGRLANLQTLRLDGNELSGPVPSELSRLTDLQFLRLGGNELSGSIPSELSRLTDLQYLGLGGNGLSGSIPSELGRLANLQTLQLNGNKLTGSIPSELGRLANLQFLRLHDNGLSGSIPSELGRLANLQTLRLHDNGLSGSIPSELSWLTDLQFLRLGGNGLSGSIPSELGRLANLQTLQLNGNKLTGSIPSELGRLANLQFLRLHDNGLSGSIPSELGRLANLQTLRLDGNELSGPVPSELSRLTDLQFLRLGGNELSGSIPSELSRLTDLQYLGLGGNGLSGSIPSELGRLANLQTLQLNGNKLTGSIPSELGRLANLQFLRLHDNGLSGSIPSELGRLANLQTLRLDDNELSGPVPSELSRLTDLQFLRLGGNGLSGSIPSELSRLTDLQYLGLGGNGLSGSVPSELGRLANLQYLRLDGNGLSGSVPSELGRLANLQILRLDGNKLSGSIPSELSRFDPYSKGPMDLIEGTEPHREFTVSSEIWDVWLCDSSPGNFTRSPDEIVVFLNQEITPYYRWMSNGRYQPQFRYLDRTEGPHLSGCIEAVQTEREVMSSDNRFIVIDGDGSGRYGAYSGWARSGENGYVGAIGLYVPIIIHEVGHALGFPHSYGGLIHWEFENSSGGRRRRSAGDVYEYDNPMDMMSSHARNNMAMIAVHRYVAGWIDPGNVVIHPQGKANTYELQPPGTGGTQMLVLRDPQFGVMITLGARVAKGYDSDIPKEGVEAYKVDQFTWRIQPTPPAELIGVTGENLDDQTKAGLTQHVHSVGEVFEVGTATVEVLERTGDNFKVRVVDSAEPSFAGRFSDDDSSAHEGNIEAIAARGVTLGCSPTYPDRFCPQRVITRAQMMAFLARALGIADGADTLTSRFADVSAGSWYSSYLERLADLGVAEPYEDGTFRPSEPLTRSDMAVFLTRAFSHISAVSEPAGAFTDVPADAAYAAEVEAVLAAGVTQGCSAEPMRYCPDESVTRAQMASFLARALEGTGLSP